LEGGTNIIILAKSKAVRDKELRFIRDRDGILKTYVTAGESYVLVIKNLGASRYERIL
jgi:hypothetical protein